MSGQWSGKEYYNLESKRRVAIIFDQNQLNEEHPANFVERQTHDSADLAHRLMSLGFEPAVYRNLSYKQIKTKIQEISQEDHDITGCLLVIVLTYCTASYNGNISKLYADDGTYYSPEILWESFTGDKCPKLAGKPKMFFIQAAKVDNYYEDDNTGTENSYTIPAHSDFLFLFSKLNDTSRFIHVIKYVLKMHASNIHMLLLLTKLLNNLNCKEDIPNVVSMLTRKLFIG